MISTALKDAAWAVFPAQALQIVTAEPISKDHQILMFTGAFCSAGITYLFTKQRKFAFMAVGFGATLTKLIIRETNRMMKEGCIPPEGWLNWYEKYTFCKYR